LENVLVIIRGWKRGAEWVSSRRNLEKMLMPAHGIQGLMSRMRHLKKDQEK
jgi:hypothetical protein